LFDLSDLTLPVSNVEQRHHWLCSQCCKVSLACTACICGNVQFVPYIDRRPLLLSKEVKNRIVDLIDEAADKVPELAEIEDQLYLTGEYMPFLSRLLDDAELAERRRDETGRGYRRTDLSVSELVSLFREMRLPPTSEAK